MATIRDFEENVSNFNEIRDKTMSILGMNTQLWGSELIGLKVGDVFGEAKSTSNIENKDSTHINKEITVRTEIAKFNEEYTVPINDEIQQIIKEFIDWKAQNKESVNLDAPLFSSRNGGKMNITELYEVITKVFKNSGCFDRI